MIKSWLGPLLLMWMCATGLHAAGDDSLIVPGEKIGQITLDSGLSTVNKLLGLPTTSSEDADTWTSKAVPVEQTAVVYKLNHEQERLAVRQVSVTSAFFHTPKENSTKSDVAAWWQEFPELRYVRYGDKGDTSHIQLYDAPDEGIALMIQLNPHPAAGESWGRCLAVIVHRRGERPELVDLSPRPPMAN